MHVAPLLLSVSAERARNAKVATLDETREAKEKVMSVKVSSMTHEKAVQLHKFQRYSSAKRAWGKDQKLLQCNLLLVPTSKNYTVLLAMGRKDKGE